MSISTGDSTDGVRTGLAGRIANAIVSAFAPGFAVTYPAGTNQKIGLNSLAQGIVDALNNDKIDVKTQLSGKASGQAHTTVSTSIPGTGAFAVLNYDTVDEDTDSAIGTGAAWKFTCKRAGQYHLSATGGLAAPTVAGAVIITAAVNGAEVKRGDRKNFVVNETLTLTVTCDLQLALNDFVQIMLLQTSGVAVNTEASSVVNHFSIHLIPGT